MISHHRSFLGILFASALFCSATGCGDDIAPGDYVLLRIAFAEQKDNASCYPNGEIPKEVKEDSSSFREGATVVLYRGPTDAFYLDMGESVMEGTRDGDTFTFSGKSVDVDYINGISAQVILDSDHNGIEDNMQPYLDADKDGLDDRFDDDSVDLDGDGQDDRFEDDQVDVNADGVDDRYTEITPAMDGDKLTGSISRTVSFTLVDQQVEGSVKSTSRVTCSGATCPKELADCTQKVEFVGTVVEEAAVEHRL